MTSQNISEKAMRNLELHNSQNITSEKVKQTGEGDNRPTINKTDVSDEEYIVENSRLGDNLSKDPEENAPHIKKILKKKLNSSSSAVGVINSDGEQYEKRSAENKKIAKDD